MVGLKHLYFLACDKAGGVYHYTLENELFSFREKLDLDCPMYMITEGRKAYIILREIDSTTRFGGLIVCDIAEDGSLKNPSEPVSTNGIVPCHLCRNGGNTYVVNYLSGNLVKNDGPTVTHNGVGVNLPRQDMPHTHFVSPAPDGYLLCCDLGLDTVFVYDENLCEISKAKVPDGMGPRHLEFSKDGKTVWCVNELGNTVSIFDYEKGHLTLRETVDALPDFSGKNTAAAIRRKGDLLFVSHRGADTIAVFKILSDGGLKLMESTPCGGSSPRDILPVGEFLLSANETTDNVTVLKSEGEKLIVSDIAFEMKNPLCICSLEI